MSEITWSKIIRLIPGNIEFQVLSVSFTCHYWNCILYLNDHCWASVVCVWICVTTTIYISWSRLRCKTKIRKIVSHKKDISSEKYERLVDLKYSEGSNKIFQKKCFHQKGFSAHNFFQKHCFYTKVRPIESFSNFASIGGAFVIKLFFFKKL